VLTNHLINVSVIELKVEEFFNIENQLLVGFNKGVSLLLYGSVQTFLVKYSW